ncbi:hypothetical protein HMN09_01331800 [Mycena chlorophos]|uniref:ABM domain-containing protein n=1 Tax=Mycena chlorophos TaxID=658473 RepID=A0A8H6RZF5_MYCCL|nr:hypothetical protein HMN09_01331800 [Mycena chlorophos]
MPASNITRSLYGSTTAKGDKIEDIKVFFNKSKDLRNDNDNGAAGVQWYSLQYANNKFASFGTFRSAADLQAHVSEPIVEEFKKQAADFFTAPLDFAPGEIIANKIVLGRTPAVGVSLHLYPKASAVDEFRASLSPDGALMREVHADQGSVAWYAIEMADHTFVIFTFFEDAAARKSSQGSAPSQALNRDAAKFFDHAPEMELFDIVAAHVVL